MAESAARGFSEQRLRRLAAAIEEDVRRRRYFGAVIAVARGGRVGLFEAIGHADPDARRPLSRDSVFSLFSVTKALTNALVFQAIEQGRLALTTRVAAIIPEFAGGLRERITFYDLLTHSSGLPSLFLPRPGMCIDRLDEVVAAICAEVRSEAPPGERVTYAPMAAHALMGEAVRRLDPQGRRYAQIVQEEIFHPLAMQSSSIGVRRDLKARHVVPHFLESMGFQHLGHSNLGPNGAFEEEHAEMPWVGAVSTVPDLFRFAEMLRRGGELDGARILAPALLAEATINRTGEKPNELYMQLLASRGWAPYPAYIGLGFFLRGEAICPHQFGTLASPRTFGNTGYGSTIF
ncbi:MAG TPA: serine hydrolase domain-containing protein, partial [Steroidobacteraceae bacterium]|nr:serine hydrolase domain-containing protein [Steroidobacteraceae bacterium]